MSTKPLVLVTGASGFLGSVVVHQLLEAGFPVRGAARGRKVAALQESFAKYPQFKVVEIADVATSDYREALDGVGAIIHTAAPLPGRVDNATALKIAIDGSLHILREATKAGVGKVVVTGSLITFPDGKYGPDDWVSVTKEEALVGNSFVLYMAEKKFGELAVLEYAEEHPEMDITIFCPAWIFGPLSPGFESIVPTPEGAFAAFSTDGFIYQLLRPDNTNYHYTPGTIDVRDVARIHIAALSAPTPNGTRPRRVPLVYPQQTDFRDAIKFIYDERPELRARLANPDSVPRWPTYTREVDAASLEEFFGFPISRFKTWRETIIDGVDRFIEIEEYWKSKGFAVEVPKEPPILCASASSHCHGVHRICFSSDEPSFDIQPQVPFLELPEELILSVLDNLSELDLLELRQVSSVLQHLSLSVILARHGIRNPQAQLNGPVNISYTALRAIDASYPTILTQLRQLELRQKPPASLKKFIPDTLVALLNNPKRPVVIIQHLYATIVRPKRVSVLERAWHSVHSRPSGDPGQRIDNHQLAQKLQFSLAASTSLLHLQLSSIRLQSFPQTSAALGAFVLFNPSKVVYLKLADDGEISPAEWAYMLPHPSLHFPVLKTLSIHVDIDHAALNPFLERHDRLERVDLFKDWTGSTVKAFTAPTLPKLSHFSASCRVAASFLRTNHSFPNLHTFNVGVGGDDEANAPRYFDAVMDMLADPIRSSVIELTIRFEQVIAPSRSEGIYHKPIAHVKQLRITGWQTDDLGSVANFARWLAIVFPALSKLIIERKLGYRIKGPMVSNELISAITLACPNVLLKQESYL
ncbi:Epimerase domain-containing protein [Mycena indigotica]|uniref:Epimerase domain-containing protein n=1 Tax=Mycena indigotica TaxID=2126181 RepID=A0A8H6W6Y0_9AGAR|nr:Epimerase domain-containing protein [Mycena indigotica]KAF7303873.1 Epimerase domain-containing protein [Mycena indigotica]